MTLDFMTHLNVLPRDLFGLAVCVLLGALFQAAETGLLTMTDARIREIVREADLKDQRVRRLLRLWIDRPDHVLTAIAVGRHSAHMAVVIGTAVVLVGAEAGLTMTPLFGLILGVVMLATIVTVELVARAIAKERAEFAVALSFPLVLIAYGTSWPLVMGLTRLSRLASRMVGGSATRTGPFVTERDIMAMIALGRKTGAIDKAEGRMLTSIIELGDTLVREVMVARTDISCLPIEATYAEVMTEVREEGHSRVPVYDGTLDDIRGFFHTKDLLTIDIDPARFKLRQHLRPVEFVPELGRVSDLLRTFQRRKTHLAVVVDEFGGTAGIVALEDVLEEIVGPIQDEHDEEEPQIKKVSDTQYAAEGRVSLYELAEVIGVVFPDGGYETLGGFLIARAGRMPSEGDRIGFQGYVFTVVEGDERKVSRVDIERTASGATLPPGNGEAAPDDNTDDGDDDGAHEERRDLLDDSLPPDHP